MLFLPAACGCFTQIECPVPPAPASKAFGGDLMLAVGVRYHQQRGVAIKVPHSTPDIAEAGFEAAPRPEIAFKESGLCRIDQAQTVVRNVRCFAKDAKPRGEVGKQESVLPGKGREGADFHLHFGDDAQRAARTRHQTG